MKQNKLQQLLSNLTKTEINAFRKFLNSPYFNNREDVIELFEILIERSKPIEELTDKRDIFKLIYPNESKYNDQNFRLLMSYLTRLAEKFIAFESIGTDQHFLKLKTIQTYRKRNLNDLFEKSIKQLEDSLIKKKHRNVLFFNKLTQIQAEKYQFLSTQQATQKLNLQETSDTIDIAYLALKLKQTCDLLAHQNISKSQYEIGFLEEVLNYVETQDLLNIPAINVYYQEYFMLKEPEEEGHFQKFKLLLFQHGDKFSATEVRDLYLAAVNFCIRQVNEGKKNYFHEALDLYKEALKKGYLLENGVLSRRTYINIAAMGLQTKEYEWTDSFIKTYKNHLEKKYRESSFSFNLARLEYARKNYDAVMDLVQKSNYRDLFVNLASKTLLLKVYFETEEFDLLHSHLEAMNNYIRRKHIIGYHRENYSNIVKYAKRLTALNPFDKKEKEDLRKRIEGEEKLTEKEWFLAQL